MDWPVVFRTHSQIEARVVAGLLESHGVQVVQLSERTPSVFPFSAEGLAEVRIAVPPDSADAARRLIETHRTDSGASVVRLGREYDVLEQRLDYRFRDRGLLEHALTHRSHAHEDASGGAADNEALEFLGDAVLGLIIAELLFREFPMFREGQMSKVKGTLVSTASLAAAAERVGLGAALLLGRGEEKTGGRQKQALLADACEAVIAAIYLDGGLEEARRFVLRELAGAIERVRSPEFLRDYKSALQEQLQAGGRARPEYTVAGTSGPDHDKVFTVEVRIGDRILGTGRGRSKKDAEQEAARQALEKLKEQED
ncbi:MAG TPA: ribonuclease III [Vicinamibacterales bacterium]|nr:ribonuclease III [Vicinamibacterales bacterium]